MNEKNEKNEEPKQQVRTVAFMSKEDALLCGFFSRQEVDSLVETVHADLNLVRIGADQTHQGGETPLAKLIVDSLRGVGHSKRRTPLRKPQDGHLYQPFHNGLGVPLKFVRAYMNQDVHYRAHFSLLGDRRDSSSNADSDPVSPEHEEAVMNAVRAACANKLKVYTKCCYGGHEAVPTDQAWVHLALTDVVNPIQVNGSGDNLRVAYSYKWKPDSNARAPFDLDAAVVRRDAHGNDHLVVAIEIQRDHANSAAKRGAFERFGTVNVQISSTEINSVFQRDGGIGRHGPVDRDVIVQHHPVSKSHSWICAPCEAKEEDRRHKQLLENKELKERNRLLTTYQEQVVTDYDRFKGGHYVRAFLSDHPKTRMSKHDETAFHVRLHESTSDARDLKNPRFITVEVDEDTIEQWVDLYERLPKNSKEQMVTLQLPEGLPASHRFLRSSKLPSFPVVGSTPPGFEEWNRRCHQTQTRLLENPSRVIVRTLKSCGICISDEWVAPSDATAAFQPNDRNLRDSTDGSVAICDSSGEHLKTVNAWEFRSVSQDGFTVLYDEIGCQDNCTLCEDMLKRNADFHRDALQKHAQDEKWREQVERKTKVAAAARALLPAPMLYYSDAERGRIERQEQIRAEKERSERMEREMKLAEAAEAERLLHEQERVEQERIQTEAAEAERQFLLNERKALLESELSNLGLSIDKVGPTPRSVTFGPLSQPKAHELAHTMARMHYLSTYKRHDYQFKVRRKEEQLKVQRRAFHGDFKSEAGRIVRDNYLYPATWPWLDPASDRNVRARVE